MFKSYLITRSNIKNLLKMQNIRLSIILLLILNAFTINIHSQTYNKEFIFPLDNHASVSGSFGELRSNHFHSGVDIGTNGKTGFPVKCMAEGVIARIKVSSVGYGKALYIKHPNGYTTVYGHLEKYASKIDSLITKAQYSEKSFEIDYFPSENVYIRQGEIIGYSGNSGSSGGPHLHYEIRDTKTEEPINPLLFPSKITDNISPKLLALRIYPIDELSTVNGKNQEINISLVFYEGKYHLKGNEKVFASGRIGLGIQMLDYMSDSWKRCGVYKLNMKVNNLDYFGWTLDRFSFDESRYINSHIDYAYYKNNGIRFERCYRQPNNKLNIYTHNINDGIITINEEKSIIISTEDAKGNSAILDFNIFKDNPVINTNQDPHSHNSKLSYKKDHQINKNSVSCLIPAFSLYDDYNIDIIEAGFNEYTIGKEIIPLHQNITITIDIPDSLKKYQDKLTVANIYKGKKYYSGGILWGDKISINTKNFGTYSLEPDTISPTIKVLQNIKGLSFSKNFVLRFVIDDNYSGIKTYNGYIDNEWTLLEYDAKTKTLTCPLNKAINQNKGKHELKLIIEDNCSNKKEYFSTFILL